MTTNHPAHGPVSLDRLHQIREILSKASAQSDGGNLGYAMADAVKVINGAIAAFGAEPVAWRYRYVHTPKTEEHGSPFTTEWKLCDSEDECNPSDCFERQPLFSAPPAPASVPSATDERAAFNSWNNEVDCPLAGLTVKQAAWLGWLKRSGTIKAFEPATDEFEAWAKAEGLIHDSYGMRTVNTSADVARKAWNHCRDAMLQLYGNSEQLDEVGSWNNHRNTPTAQADNSPVTPDDVLRMDWLVSKTVDVREPMVYGSHSIFWSQTITDEDDDYHATKLREQIDAAMAAEQAAAPQQEVN